MTDKIEEFFMLAVRYQALVHTGKWLCENCNDPIDDDGFCGTCREMGCRSPEAS